MTILSKITDSDLKEFLKNCSEYVPLDVDRAFFITKNFIKRHRGIVIPECDIIEVLGIEKRWYESLDKKQPDYSVYSDPYYFCEVWLCWMNYSRRYIRDISNKKSLFTKSIIDDMENVNTILDVGCGFAYTTVALKELFPSATVYGTNIKDTPQYKIAKRFEQTEGIKIVDNLPTTEVDLLFASEYFEHFQSPISHLRELLLKYNPRHLIIANTFNGKAIGHFNEYEFNGDYYDGKQMSKMFNALLRVNGYISVETNCWNNRPTYWKKNKSANTALIEKFF
jgi:SAM-dependent methyltransferase